MPLDRAFRTDDIEHMVADTVTITGFSGDQIGAYVARPASPVDAPAMVVLHHAPGWDDWYHETALKFARRGYITILPNLYQRYGHGTPEEIGAKNRPAGGVSTEQVIADVQGAIDHVRAIAGHNGKIGMIGSCSAGRHALLVATAIPEQVDAVADLWGGGVIVKPEEISSMRPINLIEHLHKIKAVVLGIFGNEDNDPSPAHVDQIEATLKGAGIEYEFHRYDGAGHGFFSYDRPEYRQEQAVDGWNKVFDFFAKHLA